MKKIILITLLLFILSISGLFAQPAWVRKQATPQENTLNDITRIPGTDKLVAVGEGSTVMISDDAGESWQILLHPAGFHNGYKCKTVKFIDENTGFIGGSYRTMLKTTNGGYYWTKVIDATTVYEDEAFQSIAFPVHDTGFAVNDLGEVYKTVNTGSEWNKIQLNTYFTPTRVLFLNSTEGFVIGGSTSQFLKTRDGGLSWDSIGMPDGLPANYVISEIKFINDSIGFAFVKGNNQAKIMRTSDKGVTWQSVYSYSDMYTCMFSFADQLKGIAIYSTWGYSEAILITYDGGLTWQLNNDDHLPWYSVNAIQSILPQTYITIGKNIVNMNRSIDGGNLWELLGAHNIPGDILDEKVFDQANVYAMVDNYNSGVAYHMLMKTENRGLNWSNVYSEFFYGGGGFHFISPDTGFMIRNDNSAMSILRTTNSGLDWEEFPVASEFKAWDVSFSDYRNGMIVGYSNLFRTIDAGETWENITAGINNGAIYKIEYLNNEKVIGLGVFMDSTCIYISGDGGDTWQVKTIGKFSYPQTLYLFNDSTYFVSTYIHIFKTTDGGNTWISGNFDQSYSILINSIYFPSADTGYAVGEGAYINALRTVDGGLNWTVSETNSSSALNKVYFNDNNHGLAFGNLGLVLETTTGGVADAKKPDKAVQQIYFTPQPNPFTDQLTLQFETANNAGKSTLVITDLSGKTIKIISIGGKIDQLLLNLPQLSKGVYLLNLYQGNRLLQSEKVVKQ